jgi:hypothetical protein
MDDSSLGIPRVSDRAAVRPVAMRHPSRFKLGQRFSEGLDERPRLSLVLCSLQASPQELDRQGEFTLVKQVTSSCRLPVASLLKTRFRKALGPKRSSSATVRSS